MRDEEISTEIINRFKNIQKKRVGGDSRRNRVHVSDLTQECMRRPWYRFHIDTPPLTYKTICNFWLGHILHENSPLGNRNEVSLAANIRTMEPIKDKSKEITEYNMYDCVVGTADDVLEFEGEIVITDKKTYSSKYGKKKEPDTAYVDQINIYGFLLYICEGVKPSKGAILYLDKDKSFMDPICFTFPLKSTEEVKTIILKKLDQLRMLVPPNRVVTKWCIFCPYKDTACHPMGVPKFF